jgi:hypothetical protein
VRSTERSEARKAAAAKPQRPNIDYQVVTGVSLGIRANIYSIHLVFEQYQPTKSPRKNAGRSFQQPPNS